MIAITLLAALLASPPQGTTEMTRSVLTDVCLPYVGGEATDAVAAEFLGFVSVASEERAVDLATEDEGYLLRLATDGSAEDGDLNRICVLQARRGTLAELRSAVGRPLAAAGFTADAGQPADRPVWTRNGVTVSLRHTEGRAAILRVRWSALDAEGL